MTVIFPLLRAAFCVIYAQVLPRFDNFQDINIKLHCRAEPWVALESAVVKADHTELAFPSHHSELYYRCLSFFPSKKSRRQVCADERKDAGLREARQPQPRTLEKGSVQPRPAPAEGAPATVPEMQQSTPTFGSLRERRSSPWPSLGSTACSVNAVTECDVRVNKPGHLVTSFFSDSLTDAAQGVGGNERRIWKALPSANGNLIYALLLWVCLNF